MTSIKRKRAELLQSCQSVFRCPLCRSAMAVSQFQSLMCGHGHTFDISKQGYVNFLNKSVKTRYDRQLFEARRALFDSREFFGPVQKEIAAIISRIQSPQTKTAAILDAGCGEGTHLAAVCKWLQPAFSVTGMGIDLSKEGVLHAAKAFGDHLVFAVADVADAPFADSCFDVVMSVLSPWNYKECSRLLRKGGTVIKAVPRRDYLKEVREFFFGDSPRRNDTADSAAGRFQAGFQTFERKRLCYTKTLLQPDLERLVKMTPLTWKCTDENIRRFISRKAADITIDIDILIGTGPL
ncbi:methyltransferase domain-containing protein [Bacillus amyloliquefaciens]|uniref:methyltransferase domain-containing protein n=1 Tax=Bacillus amyloliquefaciens group TaxID=1938374 RepID=UPI00141911FB|nr:MULTISPECIES: methyltransferase domain-containing protein [Bacillus amyloliquefaciens group]MBI0441364.1 methyltransferase domain-containing protein [Bacillus velezensis]NIH00391.1 methyltransferase domain-containing protein [Bacillus amyloliquefaciens]